MLILTPCLSCICHLHLISFHPVIWEDDDISTSHSLSLHLQNEIFQIMLSDNSRPASLNTQGFELQTVTEMLESVEMLNRTHLVSLLPECPILHNLIFIRRGGWAACDDTQIETQPENRRRWWHWISVWNINIYHCISVSVPCVNNTSAVYRVTGCSSQDNVGIWWWR